MSDIDSSAIPGGTPGDQVKPEDLPQFRILAQYIKDVSFENPNAPDSLRPNEVQPTTDVGIDVQAKRREGEEFEATIRLNISSRRDDQVSFILELEYSGVFMVKNVPDESLQPLLLHWHHQKNGPFPYRQRLRNRDHFYHVREYLCLLQVRPCQLPDYQPKQAGCE